MTDSQPEKKPESSFRQGYQNVPGMKEALETLKPEYWAAKDTPRSMFAGPMDALRGAIARIDHCLDTTIRVVTTPLHNPAVLVTALPFVAEARLQYALDELSSIPEGKALVDAARQNNTKISLDGNPLYFGGFAAHASGANSQGNLTYEQLNVNVMGYATRGLIVGILAHELQHNLQGHNAAVRPYGDSIPTPVEQVWYNRVVEADAQATAVDIAWKLKEAGKPKAWDAMGAEPGPWSQIKDAYAEAAAKDPASVQNGVAKRAAFDEWFVAGKTQGGLQRVYNHQGVRNNLSEMQLNTAAKGDVPYKPMDVDRITKIGDLGPVNYLKIPGMRSLDDPFYRTPDWNAFQAGRLNKLHESYDENGQKQASKFALPKTANFPPPPGVKKDATVAVAPVIIKPAMVKARTMTMKI